MAPRFFGQYLMEKGVISREVFLDAIAKQSAVDLPLAALAVWTGRLTRPQLERLDAESRRSGQPPMEIALREKLLAPADLEELGRCRLQHGMVLAETLLRTGVLRLAQLAAALDDYRREFPEPAGAVLPKGAAVPHPEIVQALLESFLDIFVHYTKQVARVVGASGAAPGEPPGTRLFGQKLAGDVALHFVVSMPDPLVLAIAQEMLGQPASAVDDAALDAMSEFVNVVLGTACSKLVEAGGRASVAAPQQLVPAERLARLRAPQAALELETTKGHLRLLVLFADTL